MNVGTFKFMTSWVRKNFYERGKSELFYDDITVNVVVHVRRGDFVRGAAKSDKHIRKNAVVSDSCFAELTNNIVKELELVVNKPICVYIFSENEPVSGRFLNEAGNESKLLDMITTTACKYIYLDKVSPLTAFNHFVNADVFVGSQSGFSVVAAFVNKYGVVFSPTREHMNGIQYDKTSCNKWNGEAFLEKFRFHEKCKKKYLQNKIG